jgi:phenylpropionate dioxygenase-like ring-hydroxylating dioxygenase large terminal subunit
VGPEDYRLRSEGSTLIAEAPARARRGRGAPKIDTRGDIEKTLFQLVCPGNTFNLFPGQPHLLMYWFEPISPTRTIGAFEYYFADDTDEEYQEDLQRFFDEVGDEDVALVEAVQVGLSSGMVPHGRVLPDSEVLIQRFHRYVYDAVTA